MPRNTCCGRNVFYTHDCNSYCVPEERLHTDIMWANPEYSKAYHAEYTKNYPRRCCAFVRAFEIVSLTDPREPPEIPDEIAWQFPKLTQALLITVRWPTRTPEEFFAHA